MCMCYTYIHTHAYTRIHTPHREQKRRFAHVPTMKLPAKESVKPPNFARNGWLWIRSRRRELHGRLGRYVCMYVCMYACMYACICVCCVYVYMYVCMPVCVYVYMYVCIYAFVCCVCMYVFVCCVFMYVCIYVCVVYVHMCMAGRRLWRCI